MERNIKIAYVLICLRYSWFWLGIWVLYYLKFTTYAGIGLLETGFVIAITLSEIPTGAIADLFGKKNTLILSFALQAIGVYIMAIAPSFAIIALGIFIASIGGSFFSGTHEALVYDSLKEKNNEDRYDKVISNITTLTYIAPAVCGIIGGYLYSLNNSYPFFATAGTNILALFLCILLIEPHIDTEKFSFRNYLSQLKQGFNQLFKPMI